MIKLIFILEEASAAEFLKSFIRRIMSTNVINNIEIKYISFDGKQQLDKWLGAVLKSNKNQKIIFIILRDQDNDDCVEIKNKLLNIAKKYGPSQVYVRIVCRTLESWYLAQLDAVEKALKIKHLKQYQNKKKFRDPDKIINPDIVLYNITKCKYHKIEGSIELGKYLDPDCMRSSSFKQFVSLMKNINEQLLQIIQNMHK
jgi:hypothetical protein